MPSPDEKDPTETETKRPSKVDLGGLPDFSGGEVPDLSASTTTGELGELSPEDQVFVEVTVPESEREPSKPKEGEAGEPAPDASKPDSSDSTG